MIKLNELTMTQEIQSVSNNDVYVNLVSFTTGKEKGTTIEMSFEKIQAHRRHGQQCDRDEHHSKEGRSAQAREG